MLRWLLLPPVALISLLSALSASTLTARVISVITAAAAVLLLLRTPRPRTPTPTGAPWRPSRPRHAQPSQSFWEQAEARIGQPLQALCRLRMRAQDRPGERWQGNQQLWLALGEHTIWFLHDATLGRLGGVWDALPRHGLHILATEHRDSHDVELSWPLIARLIIGRLDGPADERRRLLGLLAADELGLRAETQGHRSA